MNLKIHSNNITTKGKKMKSIIMLALIFMLSGTTSVQNIYSQQNSIRVKGPSFHKKGSKVIDQKEVNEKIKNHRNSLKKDMRGTWLLDENFESGNFPPADWTVSNGATEWEQGFYSGYGNGDYCMFYSNWQCNYSDNTIYTKNFNSLTQTGDKLIFDFAYAPYDDGNVYYDDLEIFYYDDNDAEWYSLIYYNGWELQTANVGDQYFTPQSNEWGTKIIDIPENASQIYFQSWENCANNIYIDNIKVGAASGGNDASVEILWGKGKVPLSYGVPEKIPVLIKNLTTNPINNLMVSLEISGTNNLSDAIEIPYIGPLDTFQVDFLGFTPILNGFSDITVSIPFDDDNGNNEKTFIMEANPNTIRYVDSNCCNSSVGWIGQNSFLNKYYMSGTGQVRTVNIKLPDWNLGQIVYGIVLNSSGTIIGKSPHYKIKASDQNTYKSFQITDPKPFIVTNDFYYVGIAQTEYAGPDFAFGSQQLYYELPARPDANYYSSLAPIGTNVGAFEFPREYGQNYAIEAVMGNQATTDAGVSDLGLTYDQYFNSATFTPTGKVFNAGTGAVSFSVRRTISPGGYSSTKSVTGLAAGANAFVNYDPWTFTSGTVYTVRDSILISDGNNSNNAMTSTITPKIAKEMCILWQQQKDRDSLVRAVISDGRYANNFDTVGMYYTGSYRPWKVMIVNFKEEGSYSPWVRDSLKSFIDNSTAGNKKSLIVFSDNTSLPNDPATGFPTPADSIFYRQYLKARTISDDWIGSIPSSQSRFRGVGFFSGITQDSVSDPYTPELIRPVNGSSSAFKPQSVTGNGSDSSIAVSFAGANYNTFFMTNQFSSLRATGGSPLSLGPVLVYTKIIDWLQSVNTNAKVLDLTALYEGLYDGSMNSMIGDTVRVYLRSATSPYAKIDSAKGFLSSAGFDSFIFNNASNGVNYYLHLKHRNGLETWSKTPQQFSSNYLSYNFTTNANKAFGDNMILKGTKWTIFSGDVNQDGVIDIGDNTLIDNDAFNFNSGYIATDLNGDGIADLGDQTIADNNGFNFVGKITPGGALINPEEPQDIISENNSDNSEIKIDHDVYESTKNLSPVIKPSDIRKHLIIKSN